MNLNFIHSSANQNINLSSDFDLNEETMDLSQILLAAQLRPKFLNCCSKVDLKVFYIENPARNPIGFFKYAQFLLAHFIILVGNMKTSGALSVSQTVLRFECPIRNSNLEWNLIFSHSSYLNMICNV